jgi:superfamily II DNA helicase RecQ
MYHSGTPQYNKDVILKSVEKPDGVVRIVFATVALGMGVNLQGINTIIHYGAPSSIDDYFQESRRGGRSGYKANSIVYWTPIHCPPTKEPKCVCEHEVNAVRRYLENNIVCRHEWLLQYFDPACAKPGIEPSECCDVCSSLSNPTEAELY